MTPTWMFEELESGRRRAGGGGGKARIRLGKTGPRGRRYPSAPRSSKQGQAVVKGSYAKAGRDANRHIRAHLTYIQERERGEKEQERTFFDRDRKGIERKEVEGAMRENQGDKAAIHKLIISPGDNSVDIADYTRETIEALEERLGHKLDWYGIIHENTEHHHAHVVIAGKIPNRERAIERQGEKERADELEKTIDKEFSTNRWDDVSDLLWKVLDLEKEKEPEREEVDPCDRDVVPERQESAEAMRINRMLDKYEREMAAKEAARERGDVYLDRGDLAELRNAGNRYLDRERSVDREIAAAMEHELGRGYEPERERDQDLERWEFEPVSDEPDRGDDRDDRSERTDDREERDLDRDDDFGR